AGVCLENWNLGVEDRAILGAKIRLVEVEMNGRRERGAKGAGGGGGVSGRGIGGSEAVGTPAGRVGVSRAAGCGIRLTASAVGIGSARPGRHGRRSRRR